LAKYLDDGFLWRRAVKGTVIAELQGIKVADAVPGCADEISDSICAAVAVLPWFYRRPIKVLALITAMVSILLTLKNLDSAGAGARNRVLSVLGFVPGFGLFRKYVRALALLALFDAVGVVVPDANRAVAE
jgi:hypothetical protein